jgi:hypothetical protein
LPGWVRPDHIPAFLVLPPPAVPEAADFGFV